MKKLVVILGSLLVHTTLIDAGEGYKAGDIASDIRLKNVNGNMVSFSQIKDAKGFIVVFCCNTCPVVKKYEQRIMDLNNRFSSKGYPVIAINSNDKNVSPGDSFEEMQKLATEKGYTFEYLYDESQNVARLFGATNTPHVYVLARKDDKLIVEYVGAIDNNADDPVKADKKYVVDAVNALLNNEQVPVSSTRAIGCGIKWRKANPAAGSVPPVLKSPASFDAFPSRHTAAAFSIATLFATGYSDIKAIPILSYSLAT